jgi:hypothetical protein
MNDSQKTVPDSYALSARLKHPCFPQPRDSNIKVWRYMNLAKLISLIQTQQLHLSRLDQLADPYEGTTTKQTAAGIDAWLKKIGSTEGYNGMRPLLQQGRKSTFVSCWHANEHESEAMWRLYGGQSGGVALQTTYAHLVNSIETLGEIYLGLVSYVDYEKVAFPDANAFYPVMHKRASFAHEREVRLVWYWGSPPEPDAPPASLSIPWKIEELCQRIYVDPSAPTYYYEAVKSVLSSMSPALASRLEWSQMKAEPFV